MTVRFCILFIATNSIGIALFLFAASQFWVEPELANVPGANIGSSFGWIVFAAPIPVLFIFTACVWTAIKAAKGGLISGLQYVGLTLAVLACWAAAYVFDNGHHGI